MSNLIDHRDSRPMDGVREVMQGPLERLCVKILSKKTADGLVPARPCYIHQLIQLRACLLDVRFNGRRNMPNSIGATSCWTDDNASPITTESCFALLQTARRDVVSKGWQNQQTPTIPQDEFSADPAVHETLDDLVSSLRAEIDKNPGACRNTYLEMERAYWDDYRKMVLTTPRTDLPDQNVSPMHILHWKWFTSTPV